MLLVEAGPGRGTLMADALRAIATAAPGFRAALRLHLIETSPRLRAIQAERLPDAIWHDGLDTLPDAPMLLLANEFLDALPIRQFVRRGDRWFERFVDEGRFVECPATPSPTLPRFAGEGAETDSLSREAGEGWGGGEAIVAEIGEAAIALARSLGTRLAARPGAALFLDYGPEHSAPGDSLQALRDGRPADPLAEPGTADLTAHVDFAAFASAARDAGAATHGPLPQGIFLTRLGLFQRTGRLARTQPPARAAALIEAAQPPGGTATAWAGCSRPWRFATLPVRPLPDSRPIHHEPTRRAAALRRPRRSARVLHPTRRRLRRTVRQPQLQPLRPGFARCRAGEPRPRRPRDRGTDRTGSSD